MDLINSRSLDVSILLYQIMSSLKTYEQDLTGKNRERGTLIPMALSKCCLSVSQGKKARRTHLDSGTDCGLELDNGLSLVGDLISAPCPRYMQGATDLVVDNDFEVQSIIIHDLLDSLQVTPC